MSEIHLDSSKNPESVLDQVRQYIEGVSLILANVQGDFAEGKATPELIQPLEDLLGKLEATVRTPNFALPAEVRSEIAQLVERVVEVISAGENWLHQAGQQMETLSRQNRARQVYRQPQSP